MGFVRSPFAGMLSPLTCAAVTIGVVLASSLAPSVLNAAVADSTATARDEESSSDDESRLIPPRLSHAGIVYLPKVSYSSETSFGFGVEIVRPFRWPNSHPATRDSDIRGKGRVTLEGQLQAEFRTNFHLSQGRWAIKTKLEYDDRPQRFWGIGPDTPAENQELNRPRTLLGYAEIIRTLFDGLRLGVRYEIQHTRYIETEPGGIVETGGLPGSEGAHVSGLGVLLDWDTRDRLYAPRSGWWVQFFGMTFSQRLGSEYDFNQYNLDARHYQSLAFDHVLATQFFVYTARGGAPFWRYAALGGRAHTRGYRKARYLDRVLLAFQGEYRAPVWWRISLVGFAGLGNVAPQFRDLQLETLRPTLGAGIRIGVRDRDDLQIRGDMAYGQDSLRFYLGVGDSF
jgi:hypothetical protein